MTRWTLVLALAFAACGDDDQHLTREQLLDPAACMKCHPDHFREWSGSMHAYASDDPLFIAMNKRGQRETGGMLGNFCVNCHAPMAVREGKTTDGLNLAQVDPRLHGVTCFFCHTVDAVMGDHNNPLHLDPEGITMRGEYSDPARNTAHHAMYSALHDRDKADSASLCGSCHDIVTPTNAAIERTFQEWHGSVFSMTAGNSCSQCHMNQSVRKQTIADAPGVPGNRYYHSHAWPAVDTALTDFPEKDTQKQLVQAFLKTELQSALCVVDYNNGTSGIRVILDNVASGHDFPSGSAQDRRLWAEVVAYKGGTQFYASGVVPDGQPPTMNPDPDFWMIRDCLLDGQNNPVHMFWQAQSYESNLLPAQLTFNALDPRFYQSHIIQSYPRDTTMHLPQMPDRVTLRMRLQPVGLDVLDDLIASGDLDASVRALMPTYDIDLSVDPKVSAPMMEWNPTDAKLGWLEDMIYPVTCVTLTNLNIAAQTTPTLNHTHCSP